MSKGAYILSTGTELSTGHSRDSNAPYLARELKQRGLHIVGLGIIPDDPALLAKGLAYLLEQPEIDLLLLSGGLGPTADDHSIDTLAKVFAQEIIEDAQVLKRLESLCRRHPEHLRLASARRQVRILKGAQVLENQVGLAPGLLLEWKSKHNECLLAAFPGVPREMEAMFQKGFLEIWEQRCSQSKEAKEDMRHRQVLYLYGLGESRFQDTFSQILSKKEFELGDDFSWGISAEAGCLKIFWEGSKLVELEHLGALVKENFKEHFVEGDAVKLLHEFCIQNKIKIGTAESCTGGLAAKLLTDRAGSSAYFQGSIVSYADGIKRSHLGVPEQILAEKGAVSEECVLAMAQGALRNLKLDFALAVSGIAGPGGGSPQKAVGTVYIGLASKKGSSKAYKLHCPLDREGVRQYSAHMAVFYLYKFISSL